MTNETSFNFVIGTQIMINNGVQDGKDGRLKSGNAEWVFHSRKYYIVSGLKRIEDAIIFIQNGMCSQTLFYTDFVFWYGTKNEFDKSDRSKDVALGNGEITYIDVKQFFRDETPKF